MKTITRILTALLMLALVVSCCCKGGKKAAQNTDPGKAVETYFNAIDKYLTDTIGNQYLGGDICVPFHSYIAVDEKNDEDILVWGDFWVMNYNIVGDTLKAISGGSHPGKMHIKMDKDGHFEVTGFEPVGDGADFQPTAEAIFGDKYADFQAAQADQEKRERIRGEVLAGVVKKYDLDVKFYQDYGWPAVEIPVK